MERISICLSDIPKEAITEATNKKKYLSIIVDKRKETDKYGNDLTVYISQSEEERKAKKDKRYIGNGKTVTFNKPTPEATPIPSEIIEPDDNLPF